MIDWAAAALSLAAVALVFFAPSYARQAAGITALAAAGFGLGRILGWQPALAWLFGPAVAILLFPRREKESRATFESLALKAVVIFAGILTALFAASHTDLTDQVWLTTLPAWLIGIEGFALILLRGGNDVIDVILFGAGGSGLLLVATGSSSPLLALACGGCLLLGAAVRRYSLSIRGDWAAAVLLVVALLFTLLALWPHLPLRMEVAGISLSLAGISLAFSALIALLGSTALEGVSIWPVVLGAIVVIGNPSPLRWAALLALGWLAPAGRRAICIAIGAFGLSSLTQLGLAQPFQGRITAAVIAVAVLFSLLAARLGLGSLLAAALTGYVVLSLSDVPASITTRIELLVCVATALAVLLELHSWIRNRDAISIERVLTLGLLFLGLFARDSTGLGMAAAVLLLIALGLGELPAEAGDAPPFQTRVLRLARSGWPPAAAFAGGVLAVIATFGASLGYGLFATALYGASILFHRSRESRSKERARTSLALGAISLLLGFAPGLLFRLLHL